VIRWFRLTRLLDAAAAADILAWENSGFSVDASVRITLLARNVPSYFRSLEHAVTSATAKGEMRRPCQMSDEGFVSTENAFHTGKTRVSAGKKLART